MLLKNACFLDSGKGHYHLVGNVYGHECYDDGTGVISSRVIKLEREGGKLEVKTKNSIYEIDIDTCNFQKDMLAEVEKLEGDENGEVGS